MSSSHRVAVVFAASVSATLFSGCTLTIQSPESETFGVTTGGGGVLSPGFHSAWSHGRVSSLSQSFGLSGGEAVPLANGEWLLAGPGPEIKSLSGTTGSEWMLVPLLGHRFTVAGGVSAPSGAWPGGRLPLSVLDPSGQTEQVLSGAVDSSNAMYAAIATIRFSSSMTSEGRLGLVKFSGATGEVVWNQFDGPTAGLLPRSYLTEEFKLVTSSSGGGRVLVVRGGDLDAEGTDHPSLQFFSAATGSALSGGGTLSSLSRMQLSQVQEDSSGRFLILGRALSGFGYSNVLLRVDSMGGLDGTFGASGVVDLDAAIASGLSGGSTDNGEQRLTMALGPGGDIYFGGMLLDGMPNLRPVFLGRLQGSTGARDMSFGTSGFVTHDVTPSQSDTLEAIFVDTTSVYIGGKTYDGSTHRAYLKRLSAATGATSPGAGGGVFDNAEALWTTSSTAATPRAVASGTSVVAQKIRPAVGGTRIQYLFQEAGGNLTLGHLDTALDGSSAGFVDLPFASAYSQPIGTPFVQPPVIASAPNGDWMVGDLEPNESGSPRLWMRRLQKTSGLPLAAFGGTGEVDLFAGPAGTCSWRTVISGGSGLFPILVTSGGKLYTLCRDPSDTLDQKVLISAFDATTGAVDSGFGPGGVKSFDLVSDLGASGPSDLNTLAFEGSIPAMIESDSGKILVVFAARTATINGSVQPTAVGFWRLLIDSTGGLDSSDSFSLTDGVDRDPAKATEFAFHEVPANLSAGGMMNASVLVQTVQDNGLPTAVSSFRRIDRTGTFVAFPAAPIPSATSISFTGVGSLMTAPDRLGSLLVSRPGVSTNAVARLSLDGTITALPAVDPARFPLLQWIIPGSFGGYWGVPFVSNGSLVPYAFAQADLIVNSGDSNSTGTMDLNSLQTLSATTSYEGLRQIRPSFDRTQALMMTFEKTPVGLRPRYLQVGLQP